MASSSSSRLASPLILVLWLVAFPCIEAGESCEPKHKPKPMPPMMPKPMPPPMMPKPMPPPMMPRPCPPPPAPAKCPRDALKLGVCADLLGLVHVVIGEPPSGHQCCALIKGLADLEAAACLCTAIKANVLGIVLDVPVALSVLLSACQKTVPPGFTCP